MPERNQDTSVELGRYVGIVKQRWRLVLIVTLVITLLSIAYSLLAPQKVTATTLVNIAVVSDQPFNSTKAASEVVDASTEEQVARSSSVLSKAEKNMGGSRSQAQIRRAMSATLSPSTTVMKITYSAPTVSRAVEGANDLATAYLDVRASTATKRVKAISAQLQARQDSLQKRLIAAVNSIPRAKSGSGEAMLAQSDRNQLNVELTNVMNDVSQLSNVDTSGGQLLTDAADSPVSISPATKLLVLSGVVGGLILGLIAALIANATDRRVRDSRDVRRSGAGLVLARLTDRKAAVPTTSDDDRDAFRSVRESFLAQTPRRDTISVLDLTGLDEASDVAANLAVTFAEGGDQTCLVLCGYPTAHVDHLVDQLQLDVTHELETATLYRSLRVNGLVVHRLSDDEAESTGLLASHLDRLRFPTDAPRPRTIIGLPGGAPRSARLSAARLSQAALLVIRERTTRQDDLGSTVAGVRGVGASVSGVVVVPKGRHLDTSSRGSAAPTVDSRHASETVSH